jgi:hypothetical protein
MRTDMPQRVFLHVGVHKTGTTHLQGELLRHRVALREAGVLYPGSESRMFRAAVDVRASHRAWGLRRRDVRGAWDDLCRRARCHDGATLLSHELFAAAARRQVVAALTMLRGLDVHVVVSTPDPTSATTREALSHWAPAVPPGNVHVLVAPGGEAGGDVLWRGLADVVGFDPVLVREAQRAVVD